MGLRAPKLCSCGRKVQPGATCECARVRRRARPSSSAQGYGSIWGREAKAWLALPGNETCACGRPAVLVAHKVAFKGNPRLQWDRKNWQPSCRPCNARQCAAIEGGFGNPVRSA